MINQYLSKSSILVFHLVTFLFKNTRLHVASILIQLPHFVRQSLLLKLHYRTYTVLSFQQLSRTGKLIAHLRFIVRYQSRFAHFAFLSNSRQNALSPRDPDLHCVGLHLFSVLQLDEPDMIQGLIGRNSLHGVPLEHLLHEVDCRMRNFTAQYFAF